MDRRQALDLLKQKSNEAAYIASLPYRNSEYLPWRRNIEDILEETFGVNSTEYKRVANTTSKTSRGTRSELQRAYIWLIARLQLEVNSIIQKCEILGLGSDTQQKENDLATSNKLKSVKPTNWKEIETAFGVTKMGFGKKINFITDPFKRTLIFRDVEQAFMLASSGFSKPAVILAGSVIEELLRLYLECKNIAPLSDNFDGYIRTCEQQRLLKNSVSRLSDSVRQFRNLVHISAEKTKKHSISKATAIGAVSSIFTIANDF